VILHAQRLPHAIMIDSRRRAWSASCVGISLACKRWMSVVIRIVTIAPEFFSGCHFQTNHDLLIRFLRLGKHPAVGHGDCGETTGQVDFPKLSGPALRPFRQEAGLPRNAIHVRPMPVWPVLCVGPRGKSYEKGDDCRDESDNAGPKTDRNVVSPI